MGFPKKKAAPAIPGVEEMWTTFRQKEADLVNEQTAVIATFIESKWGEIRTLIQQKYGKALGAIPERFDVADAVMSIVSRYMGGSDEHSYNGDRVREEVVARVDHMCNALVDEMMAGFGEPVEV